MSNDSSPNELELNRLYQQARDRRHLPQSIKSKTIKAAKKAQPQSNPLFNYLNLSLGVVATAATLTLISLLAFQSINFVSQAPLHLVQIEYHDIDASAQWENDEPMKLITYEAFRHSLWQSVNDAALEGTLATLESNHSGLAFRTCDATRVQLSDRLVGDMMQHDRIDDRLWVGGKVKLQKNTLGHIVFIEQTNEVCQSLSPT